MDEAFIWVSVISGIFGLIGLELISHNWFKKEKFKFEISNLKKQQDLQLKKLAREMGVDLKSGTPRNNPSLPNNAGGGLLDLLKGLPPESIGAITDIIQGRLGGGEGDGNLLPSGLDGLIEFATENPDIVKGFLDGMKAGGTGGDKELL